MFGTLRMTESTAPIRRYPDSELILEALPHGVLVLGSDQTVGYVNAAAQSLLPHVASGFSRCYEAFACRAPGGPCSGGCVALEPTDEGAPAPPEVRVDLPGGISPGALWLASTAVPGGDGVVVQLRSAWRGDRRRRSGTSFPAGPALRISVLGPMLVEATDDPLERDWYTQRPGQILKFLVCERNRVVNVDEITEAIWPQRDRSAVANTRYAIHRLRTMLEPRRRPHEPPSFVIGSGGGYTLASDRVWIDAEEFARTMTDARVAAARGDQVAAAADLERAVQLYRGDFLVDEPYAVWAADERRRLSGLVVKGLVDLTALARSRGDLASAISHLERLTEVDPLDGTFHRELLGALLQTGRLSDAKQRYDVFAHRRQVEFGQSPGFDLSTLAAEASRLR